MAIPFLSAKTGKEKKKKREKKYSISLVETVTIKKKRLHQSSIDSLLHNSLYHQPKALKNVDD